MDDLTRISPVRPVAPTKQSRQRIAKAIGKETLRLAEIFASATETFPRWAATSTNAGSNRVDYLKREFEILPTYLRQYFHSNDDSFLALFVGERLKAFYDPTLSTDSRRLIIEQICASESNGLRGCLQGQLSPAECDAVAGVLNRVHKQLVPNNLPAKQIIFFGDCLFLDIGGFIVSPLLEWGIAIEITYVTSRNLGELRQQFHTLGQQKFDLAFFSPFTYEFQPDYQQLLNWRNALMSRDNVESLAVSLAKQTDNILELLAESFECPIFIHNLSGLLREERGTKRLAKQVLTRRIRTYASRLGNHLLHATVDRLNESTFKHLRILDEKRIVETAGEFVAGAYFYRTDLQHPAVIGRLLAPTYVDLIYVHARLIGRKLLVCDLDNTLWDGIIGEGPIEHLHDRQNILKRLKERGVVLAILSKNDPANVHWNGGSLTAEDFVYTSISWEPKIRGMQRIAAGLNLNPKDFVFLDDRSDERELMAEAFPQTLCLDATDVVAWARLSAWADMLDDEPRMDRTTMYRQRDERTKFTGKEEGEAAADAQLFAKLQLKLRISSAGRDDLKRVAELINRTNQFNLEGRRTSFREVSEWHASGQHAILVGSTSDRFGDMGITCVAVMEVTDKRARILAFVLSCRVFGYGIERAMVNRLKRIGQERGLARLEGQYTPTAQNMPCRDFLKDNAFVDTDGVWVCDLSNDLPGDAEWLAVFTQ